MSNPKGIISLGKYWSMKMFIPMAVPVFCFLRSLANHFIIEGLPHSKQSKNRLVNDINFPISFSVFTMFSQLFGGIGEIIIYFRVKRLYINVEGNNKAANSKEIKMIVKEPTHKKKIVWVYITIVALLDLITIICFNCLSIKTNGTQSQLIIRVSQIIFAGLFSYFILKIIFHRHQILSMIIIILGIILTSAINAAYTESQSKFSECPNDEEVQELQIYHYFILLFEFMISGLQEVLEKKIMDGKYISPYKLLFLEGLIGFTIGMITLIIGNYYHINYLDQEPFAKFFSQLNNVKFIFLVILFIVSEFGLNMLVMLTNYYYTPTQRSSSDTLSCFFWWIFEASYYKKDKPVQIVVKIIGYIILTFGYILYNELIVLNICGFEKNTIYEVMERGERESNSYDDVIFEEELVQKKGLEGSE